MSKQKKEKQKARVQLVSVYTEKLKAERKAATAREEAAQVVSTASKGLLAAGWNLKSVTDASKLLRDADAEAQKLISSDNRIHNRDGPFGKLDLAAACAFHAVHEKHAPLARIAENTTQIANALGELRAIRMKHAESRV